MAASTRDAAGSGVTDWGWKHATTRVAGGRWAPGIVLSITGVSDLVDVRPKGVTFETRADAEAHNVTLATEFATRLGTDLPAPDDEIAR